MFAMTQPTRLTTSEAAAELDVTVRRVQAMIADGRLKARKIGRDWMIRPSDLDKVRDRRPGRPSK